jgi:hypothetical protein
MFGRPGIHLQNARFVVRSPAFRPGLLKTSVIARGLPLPDFDLHCPFMSLPALFRTTLATVPARIPYLVADSTDVARWNKRFLQTPVLRYAEEPGGVPSEEKAESGEEKSAFNVGLVWAGQSTHQKDRHRSLSFADFEPLLEIPGITFFSLQVGEAASQCEPPVIDRTSELKDFADTAAFVSQLDLVIAVDTAVCHMAGALGKPVWVLLAFQPDWRWLLDRTDSPWYPSARLFRQREPNDWRTPMQEVLTGLAALDFDELSRVAASFSR